MKPHFVTMFLYSFAFVTTTLNIPRQLFGRVCAFNNLLPQTAHHAFGHLAVYEASSLGQSLYC